MILLDREVTVYVTAHKPSTLAWYVKAFEELFGAATTTSGDGVWEGAVEKVVMVSHLYDRKAPDFSYYELNNLVHNYKREAMQDAVLVVERDVKAKIY